MCKNLRPKIQYCHVFFVCVPSEGSVCYAYHSPVTRIIVFRYAYPPIFQTVCYAYLSAFRHALKTRLSGYYLCWYPASMKHIKQTIAQSNMGSWNVDITEKIAMFWYLPLGAAAIVDTRNEPYAYPIVYSDWPGSMPNTGIVFGFAYLHC